LINRTDWTTEIAGQLAASEGLVLEPDHWAVMKVMSDFYDQHRVEIPMRLLITRLRESGHEHLSSSLALYRLFPDSPLRQGSRIAGLPIPLSCI
jgi:tRNA 2-thiouridine synthesizing protein E